MAGVVATQLPRKKIVRAIARDPLAQNVDEMTEDGSGTLTTAETKNIVWAQDYRLGPE